jgi:hypothetical protein
MIDWVVTTFVALAACDGAVSPANGALKDKMVQELCTLFPGIDKDKVCTPRSDMMQHSMIEKKKSRIFAQYDRKLKVAYDALRPQSAIVPSVLSAVRAASGRRLLLSRDNHDRD